MHDAIDLEVNPPTRTDIRQLIALMVAKYSDSFEDTSLGGTKIEDGTDSLFTQVENRVYNMKRTTSTDSSEIDETSPRKRQKKSSRFGCVQWEPENSASDVEIASARTDLQLLYGAREKDCSKILEPFRKCYPTIRHTINHTLYTINSLKEE